MSSSAPSGGLEDAAAGALATGGEGVLAADIAARVVGDGDDEDGIDNGVGELGGFDGAMEIGAAGGIAAVGDDHQDLAARAVFDVAGGEQNGVVERSSGFAMQRAQRTLDGGHVAREAVLLARSPS